MEGLIRDVEVRSSKSQKKHKQGEVKENGGTVRLKYVYSNARSHVEKDLFGAWNYNVVVIVEMWLREGQWWQFNVPRF